MRTSNFQSFVLPVLALVGDFAFASAASAISTLDWSLLPWAPGDRVHTYSLPADGVDLTIRISPSPSRPGLGDGILGGTTSLPVELMDFTIE